VSIEHERDHTGEVRRRAVARAGVRGATPTPPGLAAVPGLRVRAAVRDRASGEEHRHDLERPRRDLQLGDLGEQVGDRGVSRLPETTAMSACRSPRRVRLAPGGVDTRSRESGSRRRPARSAARRRRRGSSAASRGRRVPGGHPSPFGHAVVDRHSSGGAQGLGCRRHQLLAPALSPRCGPPRATARCGRRRRPRRPRPEPPRANVRALAMGRGARARSATLCGTTSGLSCIGHFLSAS